MTPWDGQTQRIHSVDGVYPTLPAHECGARDNNAIIYALQGNGIDRADTAGCNGKGWCENESYTLNTIDRHAIVMASGNAHAEIAEDKSTTLTCRHEQPLMVLCGRDNKCILNDQGGECMSISENTVGTLRAEAHHPPIACFSQSAQYGQYSTDKPLLRASGGDIGGGSEALIVNEKPKSKYIVRRLTPLECNRLQGFPDGWGVPDHKETLTEEEAAFWENVRKTHAEVNGKTYKPLKREALLKWHNGLHTDSAEYKMRGNGIALPNAYNVLKGCAEELMEEQK